MKVILKNVELKAVASWLPERKLKAATSIRSVAETVAFLLDDKAESITGQNIHVDNGTI